MESKIVPIAGRDIGEATLVCIRCNRYWGADDILEVTKPEGFWKKKPEGMCPICAGEGMDGRVYKIEDIKKEMEAKEPEEAA